MRCQHSKATFPIFLPLQIVVVPRINLFFFSPSSSRFGSIFLPIFFSLRCSQFLCTNPFCLRWKSEHSIESLAKRSKGNKFWTILLLNSRACVIFFSHSLAIECDNKSIDLSLMEKSVNPKLTYLKRIMDF